MKDEQQQVPAEGSDPGSESDEKSLISPSGAESDPQQELLNNLPPEQKEVATQFMASISEFHSRGPAVHPLINKLNEEHIHEFLSQMRLHESNAYELHKSNRWFHLGYVAIFVVLACGAVVYLLPLDREFLDSIIQIVVILLGGIGAGYGIKSRE